MKSKTIDAYRWALIAGLSLACGHTSAGERPAVLALGCVIGKEFEEFRGQHAAGIAALRAACDGHADQSGYEAGFVRPAPASLQAAGGCPPESDLYACCGVPGVPGGGIDGMKC
jgi:hypothetical protein